MEILFYSCDFFFRETELSRLAENLVQLKLGAPSMRVNNKCRTLTRKKELLLRELLSQSSVTRICSTKPLQSTLGGISSGKPVVTPSDTVISESANKLEGGTLGISNVNPRNVVLPNGPTIETKTKSNSFADSSLVPKSTINANEIQSTVTSSLQGGKTAIPENFSFAKGLNKDASVGKLSVSKKLENYYEEITPPSTPEHSVRQVTPSPNASFTFSFTPATKPNTLPPSTRSPLSSLDNIVAGIGDSSISVKSPPQSSGTFSFSSMSLGKTHLADKPEETKKTADTFKFSLSSTFNSTMASTLPGGSDNNFKVPTTPDTPLKIPLFTSTSFGSENQSHKLNMFGGSSGGEEGAKSSTPSSSGNIFSQIPTSVFGGINAGSPAKQSLPSGSIFGLQSSPIFGNQTLSTTTTVTTTAVATTVTSTASAVTSTVATATVPATSTGPSTITIPSTAVDISTTPTATPPITVTTAAVNVTSTASITTASASATDFTATVTAESEKIIPESPKKDKIASDALFAQSTSLIGSLSMGSSESVAKPVRNIFGGASTTFNFGNKSTSSENQAPSFSFGKQSNVIENQAESFSFVKATSSENQADPAENGKPESTNTEEQKSEPSSTSGGETSEAISIQQASIFGGGKTESTASGAFSFNQPSSTSSAVKPLAGSLFAPTTTNSNFTFMFPTALQSTTPLPFAQKTSIFGQSDTAATAAPATTTTTTTTTASSFFGQSICSPSVFGQSGGSVFGQTPTTTKTSMFGQTTTVTSSPTAFSQPASSASQPVFGQSSPTLPFGQTSSSGSSFLGANTGGFGSKPAFGQSGGSTFGQSGR